MAEVLTESFCERCGSRYTFEAAAPRVRLRGLKVMSRGLKTFVLDDKTSLDEAMAVARSDTDRRVTSSQLDAFHKTFNFCMECRQYTCPNCWNEAVGRCLTCAPNLDQGVLPAPFPDLDPAAGVLDLPPARFGSTTLPIGINGQVGGNGHLEGNGHVQPDSEVASDESDRADMLARLDALTMPTRPVPEVVEPLAAAPAEVIAPEFEASTSLVAEPALEPDLADPFGLNRAPIEDRADGLAAQTDEMLAGSRPGGSLADAIDAFGHDDLSVAEAILAESEVEIEAVVAESEAVVAEPEPEVVAEPEAVVAEPEPEVVAEPEAVVAEPEPEAVLAEPEPEAVVAGPEPEAVLAEPEPEAEAEVEALVAEPEAIVAEPEREVVPTLDQVEQPTWTIHAPDPTAHPDDVALPPAAVADQAWPSQPEWPAQRVSPGLPFLNRPAVPTGGVDALWAASDRAVTAPGVNRPVAGVQPCVSCGLSLSATARFCRRCGSAQA